MKRKSLLSISCLLLGGFLGLSIASNVSNVNETKANEDLYKTYIPSGDIFTKATSTSDIKDGDQFLFVYRSENVVKANGGLEGGDYLKAYDVHIEDEDLTFDNEKVKPLTLVKNDSSWYIQGVSKYLTLTADKSNKLAEKDKNNASKWTISFDNGNVNVATTFSGVTHKIFYNASGTGRFSNYSSSTMQPVELWVKSGEAKEVRLSSTIVKRNVGLNAKVSVTECVGFTASSFAWSVNQDDNYIEIVDGATSKEVEISFLKEGTAELVVIVNNNPKLKAIAEVTVTDYKYNILSLDNYYIANADGMMGENASFVSEIDMTSSSNIWNFEKAFDGDNTYYLKNNNKYLNFDEDIIQDGNRIHEIGVYDDPFNVWTIEKEDTKYRISIINKSNKKVSLATHEEQWFAFEGNDNLVDLFTSGSLEQIVVSKEPTNKVYDVGDNFNPLNMKVVAKYTNGYEKDITSLIIWDKISKGTVATGKVTLNNVEHVVTVNGLTIFAPVNGTLSASGAHSNYSINEDISLTLGNVTVTYVAGNDSQNSKIKTLNDNEFSLSPRYVSAETTSFTISLVVDPIVKRTYDINVSSPQYRPTNRIKVGDKVVIGTTLGCVPTGITGGKEMYKGDEASLITKDFGYLPQGSEVFTIESGCVSGSYSFKNESGKYLTLNDKTFDFGKPVTKTIRFEEDKPISFAWDVDVPDHGTITLTLKENNFNTKTGHDFYFTTYDGYHDTWYARGEGLFLDDEMLIEFYYCDGGEDEILIYSETFEAHLNGYTLEYIVSTESVKNEKSSFYCTYDEDYETWNINPVNNPNLNVYFNKQSNKLSLSATEDSSVMIYGNINNTLESAVSNLSVDTSLTTTTCNLGEPYAWTGIIVRADYAGGVKGKILPLGSYDITLPDTSSIGEKNVTVTYGGKTATFKINVLGKTSGVHIKQTFSSGIYVGDVGYRLTTVEEIPDDEPVFWSSSNTLVAEIDQDGVITPKKSGSVTFTVTSFDGYFVDSLTIDILQRVTGITASVSKNEIEIGEVIKIDAVVTPNDAHNKTVLYSSSDESIASVDANGFVKGIKAGTVNITCVTQGKGTGESSPYSAVVTITVLNGPVIKNVTSISLDKSSLELDVGSSVNLTVTINPSDATNKNVIWSTSDSRIASVSSSGKVTALSSGTVTIKVKSVDGNFEATCVVTVKENVEPKFGCGGSMSTFSLTISLVGFSGVFILLKKRKGI